MRRELGPAELMCRELELIDQAIVDVRRFLFASRVRGLLLNRRVGPLNLAVMAYLELAVFHASGQPEVLKALGSHLGVVDVTRVDFFALALF